MSYKHASLDDYLLTKAPEREAKLAAASAKLAAAPPPPLPPPPLVAEGAEAAVKIGLSQGLTYFHKKYPDLNSSITLYGEDHTSDYTGFLSEYTKHLRASHRTNIIILEITYTKDPLNEDNTTPILYFSRFREVNSLFPPTRIVCGDCRLIELTHLVYECQTMIEKIMEEKTFRKPIDATFLVKFESIWRKQLSIFELLLGSKRTLEEPLINERYLVLFTKLRAVLDDIKTIIKTNLDFVNEELTFFTRAHVTISNLSMLLTIIRNMERDVDITLFVGKGHMEDLTQSIKEFPFERYFEKQELERINKTREITVQKAMTMRRRSNITPLSIGGKRTRKCKQKRSTNKHNKKCRIHKKRKRMSKRQ